MKKKLKQLKAELIELKSAWSGAKKDKKSADNIKSARDEYEYMQAVIDEAEEGGAKDEDEIDYKAFGKTETKSAEATISSEELQKLLTTAVTEGIKKANPDQAKQITPEQVEAAIDLAIKKYSKDDGKTVATSDVKALVGTAMEESLANIKKASKIKHEAGDEEHEGKSIVRAEIPNSLVKGNLPLHMKQLLNICMSTVQNPRDINHGITETELRDGQRKGLQMIQKYVSHARGQKALTSTGAGAGDEWVPTDLSSELLRRFFLASNLASLLAAREIDMPTQPYEWPLLTTRPTVYLETTENVEATPSTPGTGKVTLDAKKFMGRVDFSYEVEEDSIIPILPVVQEQLSLASAAAYESAIINGDTTATHMDSDTQAIAKAAERAFTGWRKLALDITQLKFDLSTGGINEANLRAMKKGMGKYGANLRDLVWVVSSAGLSDMQNITNVSTVDKYGPRATILTGELGEFLGIPIITSAAVRDDLNASGVYDGITTTKGSILLVNLSEWIAGRRRDYTVEIDRNILSQTKYVVASFRRAFRPIEPPSATNRTVAVGYNFNS